MGLPAPTLVREAFPALGAGGLLPRGTPFDGLSPPLPLPIFFGAVSIFESISNSTLSPVAFTVVAASAQAGSTAFGSVNSGALDTFPVLAGQVQVRERVGGGLTWKAR